LGGNSERQKENQLLVIFFHAEKAFVADDLSFIVASDLVTSITTKVA
tara:strand:- start:1099 stop:1239 length:141 start_codon:yes stop_codon:yes gene_type:complete